MALPLLSSLDPPFQLQCLQSLLQKTLLTGVDALLLLTQQRTSACSLGAAQNGDPEFVVRQLLFLLQVPFGLLDFVPKLRADAKRQLGPQFLLRLDCSFTSTCVFTNSAL